MRMNRERGLQTRVIDSLFEIAQEQKFDDPNIEFLIKCSYFEIYQEQIVDL